MEQIAETILNEKGLYVTPIRKKVLTLFLEAQNDLIHSFIKKKCRGVSNRIGIYRTLQIFLKNEIIHIIPTTDNTIRYALSRSVLNDGNYSKNHIHFVCERCNAIFCLYKIITPKIKFPKKYKVQNYQIVLKGKCSNCRKKI